MLLMLIKKQLKGLLLSILVGKLSFILVHYVLLIHYLKSIKIWLSNLVYLIFLSRHLSPLVFGDYPETIKISAGNRLPSFTKEQSMMVKNSFDFIGVNYYTARFVAHDLNVDISRPRFMTDQHLQYKCKLKYLYHIYATLFGFRIFLSRKYLWINN